MATRPVSPAALLAIIGLALLILARVHVAMPLAGPVPALRLVICGELIALAVIGCGIARAAGWIQS